MKLFPEILIHMLNQFILASFTDNMKTVTYNLRNNDDYRTQRCRLQTSSKSFFPSTIKLWNSLPDSVKSLPTFSKFKKAIQPVQIPVDSFYNIGVIAW